MLTESGFQEAHLDIVRYCSHVRRFLVRCVRCDYKQEIPEDQILKGWHCAMCDYQAPKEVKKKPAEITLSIKLVPAMIKMPDGTELLVFLPLAENNNGNAGN